jgi:membrane protein YdbS with pleckstrin-like domain
MAYPRDQLHEFEELILDLHPHWWFMAKSIGALVVTGVFAIAMLIISAPTPVLYLAALLLLAALGWFLARFVKWATTDFVLTSDRVIYREGVIAKKGIEIPLERINTIFFQQGIFERIMGLGNLEIESASKDGAQVFDAIRKPSAVQNEIYRQMEINQNRHFDRMATGLQTQLQQYHQPPAAPPQAPPAQPHPGYAPDAPTQVQGQPAPAPGPAAAHGGSPSIYDQIEQLARLRDQGMISEAEFQAKKTELLGRM